MSNKMTRKQTIASIVAVAVVVGALVVHNISNPKEYIYYFPIVYSHHDSLKSEFAKHGINFGFAVSSGSFRNATTRVIIAEHASIVTTEVALKMEYTQPEQNYYNFDEGDAIVAYADELGIGVHGHTASWANQNPQWLLGGNFTRSELEQILTNHVRTLSWHYDGRLISMDSANEGYLTCGPWCPLGTNNYVRLSFDSMRALHPFPVPNGPLREPITPLVYNSNFWDGSDYDKALRLLDDGTIDGVGIQLHLDTRYDNQVILNRTDAFLDRIRNHGGFARLSEIGVSYPEGGEQEQAILYQAITSLAIKHKDIVRDVVIWGVKDPAWRGDVTLFDRNGEPKPSYYAVMEELK